MEGNQMKMREAFEEIIEKIDAWRTDGTMEHWQYSQLFDIADAALSLPRRNCDVGTAEEQAERHSRFCISQHGLCTRCPAHRRTHNGCVLAWAQMPYEAEGVAK